MVAHLRDDVLRQTGDGIDHREDDAVQFEIGIDAAADAVDGAGDERQAVHRQKFRLDRDEDAVGSDERTGHHHAERRRAVENDVIERTRLLDRRKGAADHFQPVFAHPEFKFGAGEIDFGRNDVEIRPFGRFDDIGDRLLAGQHRIKRNSLSLLQPEPERSVSLGIQVHHQHRTVAGGECRGEIDDRRRFADAALLVGDCDDLGVTFHLRQSFLKSSPRSSSSRMLCRALRFTSRSHSSTSATSHGSSTL